MMEPVHRVLSKEEFGKRVEGLRALASPCRLCPRACGVDRLNGERGFCRAGMRAWVSSAGPHFGEEPELVGHGGSGTIFLSGCNLHCVFCQNHPISQGGEGREASVEELVGTMLRLQGMGCHNVNFVSPTHQVVQIVEALTIARDRGLSLPIVWNCGGYESVEVLKLLDGIVDIYMPDFKYGHSEVASRYSAAPGYFEIAQAALREMHRQVGDLVIEDGIACHGLLVRHLILPGGLAGTEKVLQFIGEEISPDTYVNVMAQYTPSHRARDYPELSRRITGWEYEEALAISKQVGLHRVRSN
jgi:putative pyruvate formate lyase activating enzyme